MESEERINAIVVDSGTNASFAGTLAFGRMVIWMLFVASMRGLRCVWRKT